jgi:hypothetical protein
MSTQPRNEASRRSFSPAVRRLADHLESQDRDVEFYDVIALGGLAKALDIEETAQVIVEHAPLMWSSGDIECRCGSWKTKRDGDDWERPTPEYRSDAFRAHADHVAVALRSSVLDVPGEETDRSES